MATESVQHCLVRIVVLRFDRVLLWESCFDVLQSAATYRLFSKFFHIKLIFDDTAQYHAV